MHEWMWNPGSCTSLLDRESTWQEASETTSLMKPKFMIKSSILMKCLVYHGAMQTTNPWTKNLHGYTVKSVTNWMKWTSEFYSVCYGFSDKDSQSFTSETFRKVSLTKMACRFLFIYMEGFNFFSLGFFCTFCFCIISDFFLFVSLLSFLLYYLFLEAVTMETFKISPSLWSQLKFSVCKHTKLWL